MDALAAFKQLGMDAAIHCSRATEPLCFSNADGEVSGTREWREEIEVIESTPNGKLLLHTIHTPEGSLTCKTRSNQITIWVSEGLIKRHEDVDLIEKYMPVPMLNKKRVAQVYDDIGDAGILRGGLWGQQAGCWQDACWLMGVQETIMMAIDDPVWMRHLLKVLLTKKMRFIDESLNGARFDLIETGGRVERYRDFAKHAP